VICQLVTTVIGVWAALSCGIAEVDRGQPFRRICEAPPHVLFRGALWLPGGSAFVVGRSIRSADVVLFERMNKAGTAVR
jgi:hypothetical protein